MSDKYFDQTFIKNNTKILVYIIDLNKISLLNNHTYSEKANVASEYLLHLLSLQVKYNHNGKPKIERGYISISRTDNYAVVAISNKYDMGADIQSIHTPIKWEKMCERFCPSLQRKIKSRKNFIKYWTVLESIIKIEGKESFSCMNTLKKLGFNRYKLLEKKYYVVSKKNKDYYLTISSNEKIPRTHIKTIKVITS